MDEKKRVRYYLIVNNNDDDTNRKTRLRKEIDDKLYIYIYVVEMNIFGTF